MEQPGWSKMDRDLRMRVDETSRINQKSNSYPYVLIALELAFAALVPRWA